LPETVGLAFKAYEIEELADVYFFRPLGMVCARAARAVGLTPTIVTLIGAGVGIAGGALLYDQRFGLVGFAALVLHSVIDSADGQLARMTGQVTDLGRILDGVGGYLTHVAIFLAIAESMLDRYGVGMVAALVAGSAVSTILHAQMYDYYRASYARIVVKREPASRVEASYGVARMYEALQRIVAGDHERVEAAIAARASNPAVVELDRLAYRACFYWPVRGWNAMGDNTRFYAIGVLAWTHRLDWFFGFVLLPMNALFAVLWAWQRRADRRFLEGLVIL